MTEFTEFFKPITARCPACGFFGEPKRISFMISTGEKTLFRSRCANCGNVWKTSGESMKNEPFPYAVASSTCEEAEQAGAAIAKALANAMNPPYIPDSEKEDCVMQVTYNGFTGELVKLEKYENDKAARRGGWPLYDLAIYDSEAKATHCFEDVKLEDVKFMGGVMTFGG